MIYTIDMARNIDRNNQYFHVYLTILGSTDTDGDTLSNLDGEFQLFLHTYSNDVDFEQRTRPIEAKTDADGTEIVAAVAASSWVTIKTFDGVMSENVRMTRNFEYRCTTGTAGSIVYLDVQWDGVS